jgi:hypothetical protein
MFVNEVIQEESLPSPEERREILERARRVLIEARLVADQLDRLQAELGGGSQNKAPLRLETPAPLCGSSLILMHRAQSGSRQAAQIQA